MHSRVGNTQVRDGYVSSQLISYPSFVGHLWHAGSTRATVARFEKGIHLDFEED